MVVSALTEPRGHGATRNRLNARRGNIKGITGVLLNKSWGRGSNFCSFFIFLISVSRVFCIAGSFLAQLFISNLAFEPFESGPKVFLRTLKNNRIIQRRYFEMRCIRNYNRTKKQIRRRLSANSEHAWATRTLINRNFNIFWTMFKENPSIKLYLKYAWCMSEIQAWNSHSDDGDQRSTGTFPIGK